jgi:iron complex outermembrane receptor protein
MFKMTKVGLAAAIVAGGFGLSSGAVFAQAGGDRVEITGSLIKRIEGETALPVVVIRSEDLDKAGVKTAEAAVQFIAQNQSLVNSSRSIGTTNGGAAYADLRALGVERTLVLLNGQRVVKNPYSGIAVDLNVIPTVAISRIEVLTDGASATYGTDAIAGVINIITKQDYQGFQIGGSAKLPSGDGGDQYNVNLTGGIGSLATDGWNLFGGFAYTKEDRIRSIDRSYATSGIQLDRGLAKTSGTTFPGNYSQTPMGATNPTVPNCAPPDSVLIPELFGPNSCRFDYTRFIDITSEVERWSAFGRGTMNVGAGHQASLEYFLAYNKVGNVVAPTPLTSLPMRSNNPYFPGNGTTPVTRPGLDPTRPISVGWRMIPADGRESNIENTTQRLLGEIEGSVLGDWSYRATALYSQSQVDNNFTNGYVSRQKIIDGLAGANGAPFLNPFGAQTSAGVDYINASKIIGQMQDISGKLYGVNGQVSGDLMKLPAGPLSAAFLASWQKEEIDYKNNFELIRQAASSGLELAEDTSGSIRSYGLAAEFNVPLLRDAPLAKSLEVPISFRYDNYDESGGNFTPKVGVRWQPTNTLLVRGSYNKGFRAPGVFDLFAPNSVTFTSNSYDDPVLCPGGNPVAGADPARDCGQQFQQLQGGSTTVEPEESTSYSLGFVFDANKYVSVSLDYFNTKVKGVIGALPETAVFGDPPGYADKFVRCSTLSASDRAALPQCVTPGAVDPLAYIVTTTTNLGDIETAGWDVAFNAKSDPTSYGRFTFGFNGTYLTKWQQQLVAGGTFYDANGNYSVELNFPAPRWQHVMQIGWDLSDWSAFLFNRYKRGYQDYNLDTLDDAIYGNNKVGSWAVWDLSVTWRGIKGLALTAGVMNLLDKDPPFSNQGATFQVGYDPRIADPVGRAWFLQASYEFK